MLVTARARVATRTDRCLRARKSLWSKWGLTIHNVALNVDAYVWHCVAVWMVEWLANCWCCCCAVWLKPFQTFGFNSGAPQYSLVLDRFVYLPAISQTVGAKVQHPAVTELHSLTELKNCTSRLSIQRWCWALKDCHRIELAVWNTSCPQFPQDKAHHLRELRFSAITFPTKRFRRM